MSVIKAADVPAMAQTPQADLLPRLIILKVLRSLWKGDDLDLFSLAEFQSFSPEVQLYTKNLYNKLLRRRGQMDALIEQSAGPGFTTKNDFVVDVLRVVVTEFVFMKLSRRRALQITEQLLQSERYRAFLPIAVKTIKYVTEHFHPKALSSASFILNMPAWLFKKWHKKYGLGVTQQIVLSITQAPGHDVFFVQNQNLFLEELKARKLNDHIVRCPSLSRLKSAECYKKGLCFELEWSASLVADFVKVGPGEKVLDMCAAPGAKAMHLMSKNVDLTLLDIDKKGLSALNDKIARLNLKAEVILCEDATKWQADILYDVVLVDPPCLGTGRLRHNPQQKYLLKEDGVGVYTHQQYALLEAGYRQLKSGGTLIYTTNSLEEEENAIQIDKFLSNYSDCHRVHFESGEVEGLSPYITSDKDLQILPFSLSDKSGCDSLFVSRIRKS